MNTFALTIERSRAAQHAWATRPVADRLRCVREFRYRLVERADYLSKAVATDLGRPAAEVLTTELLPTASACKYLLQSAKALLHPKRIGWRPFWLMGCRDVVYHRPHGVVGLLSTWNYPLFLSAVPILHALTAGNVVAWKPSEFAPNSATALHEVLLAAGYPPEVLALLPATREAGPELAEADIDFLHFTGSDTVGRKLAAQLGERLIPSALELSGCDAIFVLPDANVPMAARAAWYSSTLNRGQTCMATRRAFVHQSIYGQFVSLLKPLVLAEAPVELMTCGQVTQAKEVMAESGCEVISAGSPAANSDRSFAPCLLLNPPPDSAVCTAATFAPVLAVIPFDHLDEAITSANRSPFGLSAAVFTADRTVANDLAARLPVGSVVVNDTIVPTAHPETPFGGRKASGWGVTQGAEGLLQMTVPQVVTHRKGTFRPHVEATLNRDPATEATMRGILRFTHGRTLGQRWRGFWQMFGGMRRMGKKRDAK